MDDLGGTYRECTPERTWERVRPHLSTYGITRVADLTELDVIGIPVFAATRPTATTVTCSQGKGPTRELARVSAAMENIETAVAERFAPAGMTRASFRQVAPDYPLDALSVGSPSALTPDTVLDWCTAQGLVDDAPALLPHQVVSLRQDTTLGWFPALFARASNGLASGNSLAEAALHALWELIERDCVARFSALPLDERVYVDPASVTDPVCARLIEQMTDSGFHLEIVDASYGDWPTFAVYLYNADMADVFGGAGAHADPAVALSRALTEAAQSRVSIISGLRDDIPDDTYRVRRRSVGMAGAPDAERRAWASTPPSPRLPDPAADAPTQVRHLAGLVSGFTGHQPLVSDLSPEHGDFSVCRVVAPGLRHDSRTRFARAGGTARNV